MGIEDGPLLAVIAAQSRGKGWTPVASVQWSKVLPIFFFFSVSIFSSRLLKNRAEEMEETAQALGQLSSHQGVHRPQ